jgi:hypothetical protein
MGRGQYDRAAAKAKREQGGDDCRLAGAIDAERKFGSFTLPPAGTEMPIRAPHTFARPGYPYLNTPETIVNAAGQPVTQADYDKLVRLCQTHGLMIDG